ncbi:GNAT family N-acetyltransferase [Chitinimonas naiadis]
MSLTPVDADRVVVRRANLDDLTAICILADEISELHHTHAPTVFAGGSGQQRDRGFWQDAITNETGIVLLAETGSQLQGFVTATLSENHAIPFILPRRLCRIGTIVVARSAQRQGIGAQLFSEVEAWSRAREAVEIRLEVFDFNQSAIRFYQGQQFGFQSHIMSKPLA